MEESILHSTKQSLNVSPSVTAFDEELLIYINSAFSALNDIGIGPDEGFVVTDETKKWSDFTLLAGTETSLGQVKTFVRLTVKLMFDPPGTSFLLKAVQDELSKQEFRLLSKREAIAIPEVVVEEVI